MNSKLKGEIQNEVVDASSRFEASLPVSSDALMALLDKWHINYACYNHEPLKTVAESKIVQTKFLSAKEGGGHIKNLYLRDHKKNQILLISEQDCIIDLKKLRYTLGVGRLSFGSSQRLFENLGVRSGAVTPFSMITGVNKGVNLFIDTKLKCCVKIYAHPMVNDKTLELSMSHLEVFFKKVGAVPNWVNL